MRDQHGGTLDHMSLELLARSAQDSYKSLQSMAEMKGVSDSGVNGVRAGTPEVRALLEAADTMVETVEHMSGPYDEDHQTPIHVRQAACHADAAALKAAVSKFRLWLASVANEED